jgi:HlyD family secretion protein
MEILASVDESDIGLIEEGQEVRFTVQAYDEAMFAGTVRQVRLQSSIQENVVTYTAVIDVDNSDGKLLPGMTATVEFLIDQASDVMKVPNAALRFRPNEQMMTEMIAQREAQQKSTESSSGEQRPSGGFGRPTGGRGGFGGGASDAVMLWYLNENGDIQVARARTGITDGSMTEVIGASLEAGMQVISGVSVTESEGGFKNPFQSKNDRGSGFSRGGGF